MQQDPIIPVEPVNTTPNPVYVGKPPKSESGWRSALSTIAILIAAPLIAVFLTAFVFQSYEVDGPSMETTLQNRDRLIVWKVPRTISRITKHDYVPTRGEVIVFVKHGLYEEGSGQEKQLIKRVVGVPGDRVVVADGKITIYNKDHLDGFNPDIEHEYTTNIAKPTTGNVDITVNDNEVFVSGDNRTNSLDSRAFGVVSTHDIVGKMVLRIYPLGSFKSYI
jgi:signal peptidase I